MKEESLILTEQINILVREKNELDAMVSTQKQIVLMKKKDVDKLRSKRGNNGEIRLRLEKCLSENKIDRTKYHAGQLEGTTIIRLFQNAESIFEKLKVHLINAGTRVCNDEEIEDMTKRYIELCTLFDGLFNRARTKSGEASEEIINETKQYVTAIMVKWRYMNLLTDMLKIHGIEDHLVDQIQRYNGIGCFIKDFIEQAHQFGMKDEKRTANTRDRCRVANSHSKWKKMAQNIKVIAKKEEVCTRSKRKLTILRGEEKKKAMKKAKKEKRKFCIDNVSLQPNPIEDYKAKLRNNNT